MKLYKIGLVLLVTAGVVVFCFFNPSTNDDFKEKTINELSDERIDVDKFFSQENSKLVNEGFSKQTNNEV